MTQKELGEQLGWNEERVGRIERAERNLRIGELIIICGYFGRTTDSMLGDNFAIEM
jgi:transcriptional regulator with XRE-family HTH domain